MNPSVHIGIFDLSSNIHRNYQSVKNKKAPIPASGFLGEVPIFAVKNTLLQLFKEQNVASRQRGQMTHVLLALDSSEKCFRFDIYPEYKANRPESEEDLRIQKKIIERCVKNLGYSLVKVDGVEADDVINSVSVKCSHHKLKTTIFSRDKDLFVLVDDCVQIYSGAEKKFFDRKAVIEGKGVPPEKIEDMLVLLGDKADNVIGVNGFGEKTIVTLLADHSLDDLISDPEIILNSTVRGKKRLHENFINSIDQIHLMRQVIRMKSDVELSQSLKDWKFEKPKVDLDQVIHRAVKELFNEGEI